MPGQPGAPVFLVLTEDGAESAVPTIEALFRAMCHLLVAGFDERKLDRSSFQPPPARHRAALTASFWKSERRKDQPSITDLIVLIAAHLRRPNGFVLFHFDGDRRYADRASSENVKKFATHLRAKVERALRDGPPGVTDPLLPRGGKRAALLCEEELQAALARLLLLTPFYCIEAWAYYNTRRLRRLCTPEEQAMVDGWEEHAGSVEEVERPWALVSAGKRHNRALAEDHFPARRALEAGRSFADTVGKLRENPALMAVLGELVFPGHEQALAPR